MRWGTIGGVVAILAGVLVPAPAVAGRAITGPCRTVLCAGVSQDGSRVVFPYEEELISGVGKRQIYEWHAGGVRALVPGRVPVPQTVALDGASADATHVFVSTSVPLAPADTDGSGWDLYDLTNGAASLISTGPLDTQSTGAPDFFAGTSPDGLRVFFDSTSALTANDLDQCPDLYQRFAGVTTLVGPNPAPPPLPLCEWAEFGGVSRDNSHVFFVSGVELEPGDEQGEDIYQQVGAAFTRLTTYPEPEWNCVESVRFIDSSSDGGTVLFTTNSAVLPEDTDRAEDIYKRRPDGSFVLVSRGTEGGAGQCGFGEDRAVALSADGHTAIFETSAQLSLDDHDAFNDLYSADDSGAIELISTGPTDPGVEEPTVVYPDWIADVADDAKQVAFETHQRLVKADKDASADVYARADGRTVLISAGRRGEPPMRPKAELSGISGDGRTVVFATREQLVDKDTNNERDVYLRRLGSKRAVLLSAETIAPRMSVSSRAERLRSGELTIRVGCPKVERDGPCHGIVKVATSRHGKPLGRSAFRIGVGKRKRIVVSVPNALVSRRHSLVFRVRGIDSLGNAALVVKRVAAMVRSR